MAGRGRIPKPDDERARTNKVAPLKVVSAKTGARQPVLPKLMPNGEHWPARTRAWWKMWSDYPLVCDFTAHDWSELMDTAVIHGAFWSGDLNRAAELRLRVAKFGVTPEDRARLRIVFAAAEDAEKPKPATVNPTRYAGLQSTGGGNAVARAELSG